MQVINLKAHFIVQLYLLGIILTIVSTTVAAKIDSATTPGGDCPSMERPKYAPDRIIFKLSKPFTKPDNSISLMTQVGSPKLKSLMQRNNLVKFDRIFRGSKPRQLRDIYIAQLPPGTEPEEVIERLNSDPAVEWAEPDYYRYTSYIDPNDEYYHESPGSRTHLDRIEVQSAWDVTTGDPNIIIAVIDSGVNYNHPDLFDNIWVNPGEVSDRNGDGRIDLHDIDLNGDRSISQDEINAASNDIDDDGNEYTDDIIGWDFVDVSASEAYEALSGEDYFQEDNNPDDFQGHGTMVAGTVSAVGNNGIGVVGVTWNSRIMVLRSGFDFGGNGVVLASAVCQAVKYAIDNGADIINISAGGYDACRYEHTVFNSAAEIGCIIVAAAGNKNTDRPHYPSSHEDVISVAATYSSDIALDSKVSFSNYGFCIDVAAPGVNFISTAVNGEYDLAHGTSFSSPVVAGIAALVKSSDIALSNDGLINQIIATCKNIDHLNPSFAGKLGAGRVNAEEAVGREFFGARPKLISKIIQYVDEECEAGKKKAKLYATIRNFGYAWGNVIATLKSTDPYITIQEGSNTVSYGIIQSQRRMSNSANPYIICVDNDLPAEYNAVFELDIYVNRILIAKEQFDLRLHPFDSSFVTGRPVVVLDPGNITTDPNSLFMRWSILGMINDYHYTVGRVPAQRDIMEWDVIPSSGTIDMSCIPLVPNQQYYVNMKPKFTDDHDWTGFSAPVMYEPISRKGLLELSSDVYSCSDIVQIKLADLDFQGKASYNVTVTTDGGDQETIILSELNGLGIFKGSIETSSDTVIVEDGTIQTRHSDIITVTYEDMDIGIGNPVPPVTTTIDCEPPIISDVQVTDVATRDVTVEFITNEPVCGTVHYGLSANSLIETAVGSCDPCYVAVNLSALEPNTKYFFAVEASDRVGNHAIDDNAGNCYTLTTSAALFVDDDGPLDGDGSSWTNAYKYLQDALVEVETLTKPVEIRIAEGMYTPDRSSTNPNGSGERGATFRLINGVTLKGGYAGLNAPNPDARNIGAFESVLSGDLQGNDVDIDDPRNLSNETTREDNAYHVLRSLYTDGSGVLDGFTVTGGNAYDNGGAMVIYRSSPTLTDCTFIGNVAEQAGGAVYNNYSDSPTFINCTFTGNIAKDRGGALYNIGSDSPTFINCNFAGNIATNNGGAVSNSSVGNPRFTGCTFTNNIVENKGGAFSSSGGNPTLTYCVFTNNLSEGHGGALYNSGVNLSAINCVFTDNTARTRGGALYSHSPNSKPVLTNCILWDNAPSEVFGMATITYSDVQGGFDSETNIDVDPLFADPENGDFHLKSEAGRWDPVSESWVKDDVTSSCIDTGDPNSAYILEQPPNGSRINMGAYGGTTEASKSP